MIRQTPLCIARQTDRDLVVVKPAGQSTEAPWAGDSLVEQVRRQVHWPDAQVPHRLDRPTRGLVVVARDRAAVAVHNEFIRAGKWTKHYVARVKPAQTHAGSPSATVPELVGPHRAYLRREGRTAHVVRSGGDPAHMEIVAASPAPEFRGQFHVLIRLDTGRFHQVRAMMAALGAPLVGDADYGGAPGRFYLEHASLWLPELATGQLVRVYNPADPERESLDPALRSILDSAAPRG